MDSELALMNEENCTELDMMNEEKNAILITSSMNLTDEVKIIFEDLVIEYFQHQLYQSNCFKKLNDVKSHLIKTIDKYLPDGENEIYSAYQSFKKNGNITVYTDGENTIYYKDQIDVKLFTGYIQQLHQKY